MRMVRKSWALLSSWCVAAWRPGFVSSGRLETVAGLNLPGSYQEKVSDSNNMFCKNLLSHGHMYSLTGMFLGNCVNAHGEKELGTKRPDFMTPPMKKRREGAHVATFATASMARMGPWSWCWFKEIEILHDNLPEDPSYLVGSIFWAGDGSRFPQAFLDFWTRTGRRKASKGPDRKQDKPIGNLQGTLSNCANPTINNP